MIPLFRPNVPKASLLDPYLKRCEEDYHYTNFGYNHGKLQEELSDKLGGHWLPVSNGTVAIQAMLSAGIPRRSRIAIPDFTFAATGLAAIHAGMTPVIFACEGEYGGMDVDLLRSKVDQWDALLIVAPFGYSLPFYRYRDLCQKYGKRMFCDFAAAFPMTLENETCSYSLHAGKSLPVGEGGLIRFSDEREYERARRLVCFDFDGDKSSLSEFGINGKMDELRCAMARLQLSRWDVLYKRIERHRDLVDSYHEALSGVGIEVKNPVFSHSDGYPSLCVLRGLPVKKIIKVGNEMDVVFRQYYAPMLSDMPAFSGVKRYGKNPESLKKYVAFPSDLEPGEFEQVIDCVLNAVNS